MGLFDRFKTTTTVEGTASWNAADYYGSWLLSNEEYERILGLSPAEMWRTQPYLRTVVTFLARNIAQLSMQVYQRVSDTDRQRLHGGIADVIARPNPATTSYELVYGMVADLALYDVTYLLLSDDPAQPVTRLPVLWVKPWGGDALGPKEYHVKSSDNGQSVIIPASEVVAIHGWSPLSLTTGSTPVAALKQILAEQVQAARYRELVWRRGGKVGAVLTRPPEAPGWSDEARKQFKKDWEGQFTGEGPRVGGTPLLEDGMTLTRVDFSAHDMQFIEGSRLALNTVASVYHVNPTMIGLLDNANYSNVREFRRMLYGDTLGPVIKQLEDRWNTFVLPRFDSRPEVYCEFNIEAKLQGNFEEQSTAIQSAVGRPWMTANEARALRNLPAVEGADELLVPLNMGQGGADNAPTPEPLQPAAALEPPTKAHPLYLVKAAATDRHVEQITQVLQAFFSRQRDATLGTDKWNEDRWNAELTADLHQVSLRVTALLGATEARALGYRANDYDPKQTVNYLQSVAERYASNINTTTKAQLDDERGDPDGDPALVYDKAINERAPGIGVGMTTFLAGFATTEAANQIAGSYGGEPTKTWVTGSNPRPDHARMNGETVGMDEAFSNGMDWPGSATGDAADVANCNCTVQINF